MLVQVRDKGGAIFGGFASEAWTKTGHFYGSESSFVFRLCPDFSVHFPSGANRNFQWCGLKFKELPNGCGFGGQVRPGRAHRSMSFVAQLLWYNSFWSGVLYAINQDESTSQEAVAIRQLQPFVSGFQLVWPSHEISSEHEQNSISFFSQPNSSFSFSLLSQLPIEAVPLSSWYCWFGITKNRFVVLYNSSLYTYATQHLAQEVC
jgi:hypothetical protein